MYIRAFDWDESNSEHIAGHAVETFEVEEVILLHKPCYQKTKQGKYIAYGVTDEGRYLFIVFAIKCNSKIRVITARDMTTKEVRYYKRRKGVK